jgi:Cu+-exporting ATPase
MFDFLKKPTTNKNLKTDTLNLSGLHCTSCAVNIDLTLEDIPGVINSKTSYQKSETTVSYDSTKTNSEKIAKELADLGYGVEK